MFATFARYRNRVCVDLKPLRLDTLEEEIKNLSHSWISHRNRAIKLNWIDWLEKPLIACMNSLYI